MRPSTLARLFLAFVVSLLVLGCAHLTKDWITPGINLVGIRPGQMTAEQQTFIVTLAVNNPNDRTLPIEGASYSLALEGEEIATGSGSLDEQIPAFGEGLVDVEVHTDLADLIQRVPDLAFAGGRWNYRVTGTLQLAGGYVPVPFSYGGEVEAAQLMSRMMLLLSG